MKAASLFSLAFAVVALSDTATAAVTQFSNYNIVSNNPYFPVSPRFTDATVNQTMVVNELANMPLGTIHSGDTINGITYAFSIFNRANPNLPNATTGQVVNNAWSGFNPVLTPPGDGTQFQPGGLAQLNDSVTLTFSTPINSFGVSLAIALLSTFNIATDVAGVSASSSGISFYGDLAGSNQHAFLGLVSDTPFSSVTLTWGNRYMGGTVKAWAGWDVTRITYGVTPVPVPASWVFYLSGLAWVSSQMSRFRLKVFGCSGKSASELNLAAHSRLFQRILCRKMAQTVEKRKKSKVLWKNNITRHTKSTPRWSYLFRNKIK